MVARRFGVSNLVDERIRIRALADALDLAREGVNALAQARGAYAAVHGLQRQPLIRHVEEPPPRRGD